LAKSKGALHAEIVKGSTGAITHRVYRGTGTLSKHRAPSRIRFKRATIGSPLEIPNIFSLHSVGQGYTLRSFGGNKFLVSLLDLVGGFGTLNQTNDTIQPLWLPSDPSHNNRPYILPDGFVQNIFSSVLPLDFPPPLDVWLVAQDCGTPTSARVLLSLHKTLTAHINASTTATFQWRWQNPICNMIAPWSNDTVKVWRISFTPATVQLFWNGIPQQIPLPVSGVTFNWLRLFSTNTGVSVYNRRLFEIATWRRILNPVEAALLLRFYQEYFNIV